MNWLARLNPLLLALAFWEPLFRLFVDELDTEPPVVYSLFDLFEEFEGIIIWLKLGLAGFVPTGYTIWLFASSSTLASLSIELIWLSAYWICSYYLRLMLAAFVYPGATLRLKFTPDPNWYTFIVFLLD